MRQWLNGMQITSGQMLKSGRRQAAVSILLFSSCIVIVTKILICTNQHSSNHIFTLYKLQRTPVK